MVDKYKNLFLNRQSVFNDSPSSRGKAGMLAGVVLLLLVLGVFTIQGVAPPTQCNDGIDNDGDGFIDGVVDTTQPSYIQYGDLDAHTDSDEQCVFYYTHHHTGTPHSVWWACPNWDDEGTPPTNFDECTNGR